LPEHVKKDESEEKRAFAAAFIVKCASAGVTDPNEIVAVAMAEIAYLRSGAVKRAEYGLDTTGNILGRAAALPLIGSVGLPLGVGMAGGYLAGGARNAADDDDAETLRIRATAHAFRRRAALAKADNQVRQLVATDPKRFIPLS
jgi:hypothetical protein